MNRRDLLVATAGTTVLGGCLDSGGDEDGSSDSEPIAPPFEIATIDAPGSEAGTVRVPQSGRVTLCNFTRTECPTSRALLSTLADAKASLQGKGYAVDGDDPDVRFLSITNATRGPSPSDDELAAWFDEYGGNWPIGRDENGACNEYYEIVGFPTTMSIDGTGDIHWRNRSGTSTRTVVQAVERALEEGTVDGEDGTTT